MQATYVEKTAMIHNLDATVRKCNEVNDKIFLFAIHLLIFETNKL